MTGHFPRKNSPGLSLTHSSWTPANRKCLLFTLLVREGLWPYSDGDAECGPPEARQR